MFNHTNLADKGVYQHRIVYRGANGALGGSNYGDTQSTGKFLYGSYGNMSWFSGATDSSGNLEQYITADGRLFDINDSYVSAVDVSNGILVWESDYGGRAHAQLRFFNGNVFTQDGKSNLYVFDGANGDMIWKMNANKYGLNGGITAPVISDNQVFWINNYVAFGIIGTPGPNGICLKLNKCLIQNECTKLSDIVAQHTFNSFDVVPKLPGVVPAVEPTINEHVKHVWCCYKLIATHTLVTPPSTAVFEFTACKYDSNNNQIILNHPIVKGNNGRMLKYNSITLINKKSYVLEYQELKNNIWLSPVTVWLSL